MLSVLVPCVFLLVPTTSDQALQIVNPRTTYGYLGATRPKEGMLPGDVAHFTFEIKNLKFDAQGKAMYSIAIEIRDADGKLFFEQKPYNAVAQNFLGGNSLPCSAHVAIPVNAKPGAVNWKITVKDRAANQTVSINGSGKVLPADFGIVQVGLWADADTRTPMSAVGVIGDSAYLQFALVGFGRDKENKQPHVHVSMRILDEQGKPTMAKPLTSPFNSDVRPDAQFIPVQFGMSMNRAGRFTIELTAEDRISGKSSQIRYAIRVLAAE